MNGTEGGATSPAGDEHPGEVVYEDEVEGRSWSEPAAHVPQSIAWYEAQPGRWIAVTRIQSTGAPGRLEITRFDATGEFVDVTVQRPPPRTATPRGDE